MIQGRIALGGLSLEFGDAQRRFDELSQRVDAVSERYEKLLAEERRILEELARIYLPELSPEAVSSGLRELETHMRRALTEQEAHRDKLARRLSETNADIERLERALADAEAAEKVAAEELAVAKKGVEDELGADSGHAERAAEHADVMERRSILKTRRARLQSTGNVERHGYEGFAPFAYLLARGYGGQDYRGGFLTRRLDAWLARRIDFERLNRNYRILRYGPHAILAEIRRLTARAEELEAEIDRRQAEVGGRHRLMPALEADAAAQRRVVESRQALLGAIERRDHLAGEVRAVQANRGGPHEDALEVHRDFLEDQTVQELLGLARATPDPRDDMLVRDLERTREAIQSCAKELEVYRTELEREANRTGSLADLVRGAAARFTSRRSYFPEETRIRDFAKTMLEAGATPEETLEEISQIHLPQRLLIPTDARGLDGWFAELSSRFDHELGAVTVHVDDDVELESEIIVHDAEGRILHRRVTRRKANDQG